MPSFDSLFDTYSLRARYLPALITTLPVVIVLALLFPQLYTTLNGAFTSVGGAAVSLFVLAHVIRSRGRKLENLLYQEWDGVPTTAWLRHRDGRLDSHTKQRYHAFLAANVPNLAMPSGQEEASNPAVADAHYGSAVKWLLEHTRNAKSYPLVFEENVAYGFRRNMVAAKPIALAFLLGTTAISALVTLPLAKSGQWSDSLSAAWIAIVVAVGLWLFMVNKTWVKDASDGYARALLASCEGL